jgi:hypothetical protein
VLLLLAVGRREALLLLLLLVLLVPPQPLKRVSRDALRAQPGQVSRLLLLDLQCVRV